jgi:tetratricopeptide (TPR) repeat protein
MFRVTSLTALSDRQMDRWIKRLAVILVVGAIAFFGFYMIDRWRPPSAPILDQRTAALEAAVQANPADIAARGQLADVYSANGRYEDAIAQYQAILETGMADEQAHMGLALAYRETGELERAASEFEAVVDIAKGGEMAKVDPMLQAAYFGLGSIAMEQGRAEDAIGHLEQALAITRSDADALNLIAAAYAQTGESDLAIKAAKAAIEFVPVGWAEPYQTLATAYEEQGEAEMAAWAAAMADFAAGATDDAQALLEPLAAGGPAAVDAQVGLGLIAETLGDLATAQGWYAKAITADPENDAARLGLSRVRDIQSGPGHPSSAPLPTLPVPGEIPGGNG